MRPGTGGLARTLPPLTFSAWLRYDLVTRMLATVPEIGTALEVGAGQGAMGARLARRYRYVGVEPDAQSFAVAQQRVGSHGGTMRHGSVDVLDSAGPFDLVCAFEVLEHLADDRAALERWRQFVRPGGWLLLSVPAHQARFGPADARVGHYRRYDPAQLVDLLFAAGFELAALRTYGFPIGYLVEMLRNRLAVLDAQEGTCDERTSASGRWLQPGASTGWLMAAAAFPFRLLQRPFLRTGLGPGLVALARRPL
jgi:SAM-dependent methyltransferase